MSRAKKKSASKKASASKKKPKAAAAPKASKASTKKKRTKPEPEPAKAASKKKTKPDPKPDPKPTKASSKKKTKPDPKPATAAAKRAKVGATPKASGKSDSAGTFEGFPKEGLTFLAELGLNNDREWFAANKQRYEQYVLQPALAFIRAMRPKLAAVSSQFEAIDKKVGGSLMRIYRDTRFATDKSPYKTNIGIQFRHAGGKDVHAPGFYLHIEPGQAFLGCGMWRPDKGPLESIRNTLADAPEKWRKVITAKDFAAHFELSGERLSRPPKGFDPQHPLIGDIKRKDHIAVCEVPAAALHDAKLVELVAARFSVVAPYVEFLCDAVGASF